MRALLDECVNWRLSRSIVGHEVKSNRQMGWSAIKNGELLALASAQFDVFITVDRNLAFQQHLPIFDIAVIVLRARSNSLVALQSLVPKLLDAISAATPGTVTIVG